MEWGTYNPQIFFGLKNRDPNPFTVGLMWRKTQSYSLLRHETPGSDIDYGWEIHDGSHFGSQVIKDKKLNLKLTTTFAKSEPEDENVPPYIVARITGEKLYKNMESEPISLMPYVTTRDEGKHLKSKTKTSTKGVVCCPVVVMDNEESFEVYFFKPNEKKKRKVSFQGGLRPYKDIWRMGDINRVLRDDYIDKRKKHQRANSGDDDEEAFYNFKTDLFLQNKVRDENNFFVLDMHFQEFPFVLDIALISKGSIESSSGKKLSDYVKDELVGDSLTKKIEEKKEKFDEKFEDTFGLKEKQVGEEYDGLGKYALSNLMGGLGYFYGDMVYEDRYSPGRNYSFRDVTQFSCVPSRSQFPRPFLWDEGFHLLLLMKWNPEIAKDILLHWFHSMDPSNGWIPREQILGNEGRSRVPEQFILQSPSIANPPTLFLAIEKLFFSKKTTEKVNVDETATITTTSSTNDHEYLSEIYPFLKKNYEWYFKTQKMKNRFAFQWGGRTENHTLASGFDDYPRGTIEPRLRTERHLDLYCWMYMMTKTMGKIAVTLGLEDDVSHFSDLKKKMEEEFEANHYDEEQRLFADFVGNYDSNFTSSNGYSNHFGYVSFFPLISGIVSPKAMGSFWEKIFNPKYTYSNFGLRSLSKHDELFGTKENYWRGKIWINMNFLVLKSIQGKKFAKVGYDKLRKALMENMNRNYNVGKKTIYENYDPITGEGTGTTPFCGWSSLILLIMSEEY